MPTTNLYVSAVSILSGTEWTDEGQIIGAADELTARYKATGADSASLGLDFDPAEIPGEATIGIVVVRLWGAWSGKGTPEPVVLELATAPPLSYDLNETPSVHENSSPDGWGLTADKYNSLTGTLSLTSNDAETFDFDAVEINVSWDAPAVQESRGAVRVRRIVRTARIHRLG